MRMLRRGLHSCNDVIDDDVHDSNEVSKLTSPKPFTLPLSFPQRIAKAKLDL